jgi:HD-like signal output (HDOD) protein
MSNSAAKTWVSSHDKVVPALDYFHQKALETLDRKTASLADLADIISLDPGMSIALFEKVNAKRNGKKQARLDSIHSLLGVLGTPAITEFVTRFKSIGSSELSSDVRQAYHQLMSQNFHLMHQVSQLIELQGMDSTHEIRAAALLHNVGEIYACLFDFKQYQTYQQKCLVTKNSAACSEPIFGFTFPELGLQLTDKKHLPDLACETQQLSKSTGRKALTIRMAAEITQQTETGWHHDALTQSIQNAAEFLSLPPDDLRKVVLSTSLDAARSFPIDDVFPAIARAILLPNIDKPLPKLTPKPVPAPPPKPVVKKQPPTPIRRSFSDKIKLLIKSPDTTQAKIIRLVISELSEELKFSRVVLMLLSKDSSVLSTRMSRGLETDSAFSKLQIEMSHSGLIKNLLAKPQSLWVNSANFKKYERLLPGSFRASCHSENFFIMSLFTGQKPIGMVFCDSTQKLDEPLYKTFKSNLLLAGKALTFLSQRSRNTH